MKTDERIYDILRLFDWMLDKVAAVANDIGGDLLTAFGG